VWTALRSGTFDAVTSPSERWTQPPIADYALVGDCHSAALVSSNASIDWCCMPRMDRGSTFGRILDAEHGGHWSIELEGAVEETSRRYLDDTMVLETTLRTSGGELRVTDVMPVGRDGGEVHHQLVRILDGVAGRVRATVEISPRFDYGAVRPWIRRHRERVWSAVGGDDAVVLTGDAELELVGDHDLRAEVDVEAGERIRFAMTAYRPEQIDPEPPPQADGAELDRRVDETVRWWRGWAGRAAEAGGSREADATRSALVLRSLTISSTGAIAAAPTTSLPEALGAGRNWDYRASWVRDSQFSVRALAELGHDAEAEGFRRFVERSAAGHADELQIMYGFGGERRLTEAELPVAGYRGSTPVRTGNAASRQLQLDAFGELLDLAWRWHQRGHSPDLDYWRFLCTLVEAAARRWSEPDAGIWEQRGDGWHFVHSKVMCWAALDRGIRMAEELDRDAPVDRWRQVRDEVREAVLDRGVDHERGTFVRAFDSRELDASLLLIPSVDFVDYDDPLVHGTVAAVVEDLDDHGLLRRYRSDDGMEGSEGTFVACTFWLAECLACQGRVEEARAAYDRALATRNDLGLFSEEYDPTEGIALGNFPQGLTHLSHITALVALDRAERGRRGETTA
jgi:GH15 family glucan-1,4-alpha-glucosidase